MSNRIETYEQLLQEKKRLQTLIQAQKEIVRYDVKAIGEELKPLSIAFRFLRNITTRKKNGVLDYGTNMMVDLLVRKMLLAKAGWITKLVVPFLVKNYTSHVMAENKVSLWERITGWFNKNGHKKSTPAGDQAPQPDAI
jgi:hypothetical protein